MTLAIDLLPASTDHATPWPPLGAKGCCPKHAGLFRDPVPPPNMLLGVDGMVVTYPTAMNPDLRGMVVTYPTAMNPALRGLGQCPCGCPYAGRCPFGLRGLGQCSCDSARRTAMSGLGAFPTELVDEATATARAWAAVYGLSLPPTPSDVIDAIWRLSATERELELLRQKLRSMRGAGIALSANDINAYKNAADSWYKAARETLNPVIDLIRRVSPSTALVIPAVPRPPSLDEPDRPLPIVPTEAEMARVRSGDLSGLSGPFGRAVDAVRGRLSGGVRGLGLFGIDDLTIGTLVLIVIGLVAIAVTVAALAIPSYALVQVLAAWVQARAAADVAERRRAFYERCLSSGSGSAECARQAASTVPMPDPVPSPDLGLSFGVGGIVLGLAAAGAAYYFLATPGGRARAGLGGLKRRRRPRR